ncbi:MAG: hypothetical protein HUJ51_05015 [Eggerthellaceae bacterium]|nr:hypothetical protein [Eggerthellaceae bacterium]
MNTEILLCGDKPTGALYYATDLTDNEILHDTSRIRKKIVILITQNSAFCQIADKVIKLKYG